MGGGNRRPEIAALHRKGKEVSLLGGKTHESGTLEEKYNRHEMKE